MTEADRTRAFSPGSVLVRRADRQAGDSKLRPCVVLSSEARGVDPSADTVIVVPLTTDTDGRQRLPMPVIVPDARNGLQHPSAAMAGRVTSVRKTRLDQRIGEVSASDLRRIRLGVVAVIGLAELLVTALPPQDIAWPDPVHDRLLENG